MTAHSKDEKAGAPGGIEGIVAARTCDCCGHHEIGLQTPGGRFIALRPGMQVRIQYDSEKNSGD